MLLLAKAQVFWFRLGQDTARPKTPAGRISDGLTGERCNNGNNPLGLCSPTRPEAYRKSRRCMPSPAPPIPTRLYRLVHIETLPTLLARGRLHAPNRTPADGLSYKTIHNLRVQANRHGCALPCGPGGTLHDYVPFYFGPHSPMLLNLHTGRVAGYSGGQDPLIYLATTVQAVQAAGYQFVFSDGHGLANFTRWFDNLADLGQVDWEVVKAKFWADRPEDNDRQRRKQAEFLVWEGLDWSLIQGIGVRISTVKEQVEGILDGYPALHRPRVVVKPGLYY